MPAALVTGGAKGIGRACVDALVERGYRVALLDVDEAGGAAAAGSYSAGTVSFFHCDVASAASFRAAYDGARAALLRDEDDVFDVVALNAGIFGALFDRAEEIVNTNLLGALRGVEMALKHATRSLTRRAPRPVLIAVTSSSNGIVPADSDFAPVYVATKFGINGAVRAMAPFGERFGVRVNAIAPVAVDTPMVQALGLNDEVRAFLDAEGRGGLLPPTDVAAALLRLIDDAALCGEVVTVHPAAGPGGRPEPLDPAGRWDYLGAWSERRSEAVRAYVDASVAAVAAGEMPAWSGV